MSELGVNVDHVATLRQARGGVEPDPVIAALACEEAGCDSIVAHLREDRRHINDEDVKKLKQAVKTRFNLEMSINPDIVRIARNIRPHQATLVPERRRELTTEGGLSVTGNKAKIKRAVELLKDKGIDVSLFIDPDRREILAAKAVGVSIIEIHTGAYSLAKGREARGREYEKIRKAVDCGLSLGMLVNAGHGLDYLNVNRIANIKGVNELNIGHSIISRAVFSGLHKAVKDMKALIK
ncbi:MAG: pyridoxine 5'-phosphate synthase [Candidatus Omnitrophica bacterium]|nr:pyridoxine 5'-phosphate synthase [Candidatus Omnitrophota bacterium]MBU1932436.1 pyridoxine 5'-phosphate synthase [Candidatus Omnitrophota bacterium]